jgi:hypothetical protein
MRLSEKTVELNFCAQATQMFMSQGSVPIWFGLTKQEAKSGFDAATKIGGRLIIFQFKASNQNIRLGGGTGRRFRAKHEQMKNLQQRCDYGRSVFYALPLIGTTVELAKQPLLISDTWLLDVTAFPDPMPPPTTRHNTPRKNGEHYIDVGGGIAIIRSEPFEVSVGTLDGVFRERATFQERTLTVDSFDGFEGFWDFRSHLTRSAAALILK